MSTQPACEDRYFAREHEPAAERRRLANLVRNFDPSTRQRLESLPVRMEGARVLEVAGGSGSIARWLAGRVGRWGAVVATDLDTRHLEALGDHRLEIRRHDILADPIEENSYDLVHCRLLLMHLVGRAEQAIERMIAALRPGGWILLEEPDFGSSQPLDPGAANVGALGRLQECAHDVLLRLEISDTRFGRRLPGAIEARGLVDVGHDGRVSVQQGGGTWARQGLDAFEVMAPRLRGSEIDETTWNEGLAVWRDPAYRFLSPVNIGVWGRKPG